MRSRMIAFCGGVALILLLPQLPFISIFVFISAALILLGFSLRDHWGHLPATIGLGLLWGIVFAQWHGQRILPEYLEGRDIWLKGTVLSIPESGERAQQFVFDVDMSCASLLPEDCDWRAIEIDSSGVFDKRRILLSYYGSEVIEPGQNWLWRSRLNRPHGFANPGGFDYEAWMFEQGLSAKGYVRENNFNRQLENKTLTLNSWRFSVLSHLFCLLQDRENRHLIIALILGERSGISAQRWALLSATGTNHLMVISGLHIGLASLFGYGIGNTLSRFSPAVLRRFPAQKIGIVLGLICALFYALLAGLSLPTQRALMMLLVFALARLCGRKFAVSNAYFFAMFIVLLMHPLGVMNAGFWLSFVAVGSLLLALSGLSRLRLRSGQLEPPSRWSTLRLDIEHWLRPQWVVSIGLCVPMVIWLQQVSSIAPLVNLIAIPFVSLIVVPLCLLGAVLAWPLPALATLVFYCADRALALLLEIMTWLLDWVGNAAMTSIAAPSALALVFMLVGTVLLLLPRGIALKPLGLVLVLPVMFPTLHSVPIGEAKITVFDVGQGLSVLIRTAQHSVVYDTGPRLGKDFDTGRGVVMPYLVNQSIRRLDKVIVSHGDNDHAGGMGSLLGLIGVDSVVSSSPKVLEGAKDTSPATRLSRCEQGQQWEWDGVQFSILHPGRGSEYEGNNSSCVLMIEAGSQRVLLPGDIEREGERSLINQYGENLEADVLLAPHHGSNSSSSSEFIAMVAPAIVMYSAGYRSQFRHPAPTVVERYSAVGARAYNPALQGALSFSIGPYTHAISPLAYRQERQRFWHLPYGEHSERLHGL